VIAIFSICLLVIL
jgi:hypothetical protein